jgi:hypothetical protein
VPSRTGHWGLRGTGRRRLIQKSLPYSPREGVDAHEPLPPFGILIKVADPRSARRLHHVTFDLRATAAGIPLAILR